MQPSYQVLILGNNRTAFEAIRSRLAERLAELGLPAGSLVYLMGEQIPKRDVRISTIAIFFGGSGTALAQQYLKAIIDESIVIIPVVTDLHAFREQVPPELEHINAIPLSGPPGGQDRIVSLLFEFFGLLRRERRIFISYKRSDSQELANLLYDELDRRGFDVFIDIRSVPPAEDFQSQLWHRMADCDVVVLIDTPGFRASRWTVKELAQANATNIQILHILWPGQKEDSESALSHFYELSKKDFIENDPTKQITHGTLDSICSVAERLRARAMAARHRYLIDNFCDAARAIRLAPSVQPERWISLPDCRGGRLAIVPAVGVPTSEKINQIFDAMISSGDSFKQIWMIYDNRGLLQSWLRHIDWLHEHLPIKAVKMSTVTEALEDACT